MAIKLTTEEFIKKAKLIHGDLYLYDKVNYTNAHTKVILTCKLHGDFSIKPNNHTAGKQGCTKCGDISSANIRKLSQQEFESRIFSIYGNSLDVSKATFISTSQKVAVTHSCGTTYQATPSNLFKGSTCPSCSINALIALNKEKCDKAKSTIASRLPNYTLLEPYVNARTPILVKHNLCNNSFASAPDNLLRKQQCPHCASFGFDPTKPAILYYICIDNTYYKIGVTNKTVKERFKANELKRITILNTWEYELGSIAYQKEQHILNLFKQYKTSQQLLTAGNTEIFSTNILTLGLLNENYFTE